MSTLASGPVLNVMIADDSSTIRLFIINALRRSHQALKLTEAGDGETCLKMLSSGSYDIAFIDLNMPRMSGLEALNQSRELGVRTFITLMSSKREPEQVEMARKLGAYEYFVKPFRAEDVLSILSNYHQLTRHRAVLLVDDSRAVRAVVHRVLEHSLFSLDIEEATDGAEALKLHAQKSHEVVFLDWNMPGISGAETLAGLRKRNPGVKVVLITTPQSRDQIEALSPQSYQAVLYKPFYTIDVDQVLHEMFGLELPELRFARAPQDKGDDKEVLYV